MKSDYRETPSGVILPDTDPYPESIKNCVKPTPTLYYRGNVTLLSHAYHLSVIGSRAVTATNERNLHHVLDGINNPALCIVSGLALGMDALAHEIALENNLPTIAVLGSSIELDEIYPRSNFGLAKRILENNGLLLSPFPPGTDIMPYNFPMRNQIIAALSRATLVVSAAKKSGALITARLALEYGNDVLVIPGNPFDLLYEGSNLLLQQGAVPIVSANDLLEYFGLNPGSLREYKTDDVFENRILVVLRERAHTADEIALRIQSNQSIIQIVLTRFELRGWIARSADGMVHLK